MWPKDSTAWEWSVRGRNQDCKSRSPTSSWSHLFSSISAWAFHSLSGREKDNMDILSMRSNCMIFAICFCWGDCYRVSFSRGQRAWGLCPRLLSTAPPSQLGFESEQLENLERPFFSNFSNLITKVWLVRQGKLSNLLWRESFCVETETQTRVGLLHPQAIMWLGRTSRPWQFFLRLRSRSYFFRERTADKIVLLVKCYEAFS